MPVASRFPCTTFQISWLPPPTDENTARKPQPEETDIRHFCFLACELVPQNHRFIQASTVLPSGRVYRKAKLSCTACVANRPDVDKFGKKSTTTKATLDDPVDLGGAPRKIRDCSRPFSSSYVQASGENKK
ncbi:hypothetical protein MRX96_051063 [Rhipicephalus microplus]